MGKKREKCGREVAVDDRGKGTLTRPTVARPAAGRKLPRSGRVADLLPSARGSRSRKRRQHRPRPRPCDCTAGLRSPSSRCSPHCPGCADPEGPETPAWAPSTPARAPPSAVACADSRGPGSPAPPRRSPSHHRSPVRRVARPPRPSSPGPLPEGKPHCQEPGHAAMGTRRPFPRGSRRNPGGSSP
eukprot:scaffold301_cov243-Pinguiococcus_pyrenoidosus.AAC.95